MALLIAILLGFAALTFVLYPLYRRGSMTDTMKRRARQEQSTSKPEVARSGQHGSQSEGAEPIVASVVLADQEQSARTALQEVEFDYQLGNIEEPDYQELRERYMRRALLALKSRYEHEQELDDEIEAQLQALKMAQGARPKAQTEEDHEEADH